MKRAVWALTAVLAVASQVLADVSKTLVLDARAVRVTSVGGYAKASVRGWPHLDTPGLPQLPARPVFVALPPGREAVGVRVVPEDTLVVATDFVPFPCQPPAILPTAGKQVPLPAFRGPEPSVYESVTPYPRELAGEVYTGYMAGVPVASTVVVPFRWAPESRTLAFYPRVRVEVATRPSSVQPRGPRLVSPTGARFRQRLLAVLGLEDAGSSVSVSQDAYDYLIVCVRECSTAFAQLAEWKTRKGVRSVVVTRETIEATNQGADFATQIRACIRDYYQDHGVWCVLLGGDTGDLPCRRAWAMDCEAGMQPDENDIPADLYFSDLDGTWDANANGTYGEVDDQVDLFPDVVVGRLPANTRAQAQAMVEKSLEYEVSAPADYQNKALFCAEVLWNTPFTDGSLAKDLIDSLYSPASLDPIQKLYETLGNESPTTVIAALNDGRNLVNHVGHCWYSAMGCGTGGLEIEHMDALTNASRYAILYSTGCWPAAIDYNCIAEHFLQNPGGGGVAFVGNSRYGWGSPGNPCYGYSDLHDQQFCRNALLPGGATTGYALSAMKTFFIPYAQQENVCRIHQYQVNLLGEPDLPVWTELPTVPVVRHPPVLPLGPSTCRISVEAGGVPFEEALVCLCQEEEEYLREFTDASGTVTLSPDLRSAAEVDLTVTGHNLRPYMVTLPVATAGAFVEIGEYWFEEALPPSNGVPNPGEDLYLSVTLHNVGVDSSGPVTTVLRAPASWAIVTDSSESFPTLAPGEMTTGDRAYRLLVSPSTGLGDGCPLQLGLSTPADSVFLTVPLVVAVPMPQCVGATVEDAGGDGQFDPGEGASLELLLGNAGNDTACGLQGVLSSLDPWLTVTQGLAAFGTLAPAEQAGSSPRFELALDAGSPSPRVAQALLELSDSRWSWQDTVWLALGATGFDDDMERGDGAWTYAGETNHWHRSSSRSHSGTYSWYCGQGETRQYVSSSRDTLLSPTIVLGNDPTLSFWIWFDVTIYGTDGLYVEVLGPDGWVRLAYIGSGGALERTLMGHDWAVYTYDLGWLDRGANTRLRFIFWSDGSGVAEGFYLDDVLVWPCTQDTVTVATGEHAGPPHPGGLHLVPAVPNPATGAPTITYHVGAGCGNGARRVTLTIYDAVGRVVATPVDRIHTTGLYSVRWDLRTADNKRARSGLYFLRLDADNPAARDINRLVVIQ
jgi:hypothetical protein